LVGTLFGAKIAKLNAAKMCFSYFLILLLQQFDAQFA